MKYAPFKPARIAMMTLAQHQTLIENLCQPAVWPHPVQSVECLQTHISSILLTGDYAYKIKKPVDFGFVDFTTLQLRKHFCDEEIRLNARLAPEIYLRTVAITGTIDQPQIDGPGEAIEYAVMMRQFDSHALLDERIKQGTLDPAIISQLARRIAEFHQHIAIADRDSRFGDAAQVYAPMQQNFDQIRQHIDDPAVLQTLQRIEVWSRQTFTRLKPLLQQRKVQGFIRECHGDMHLGNIAWDHGQLIIFDGIEFNDDFRWIDVISELAFLSMDLIDKQAVSSAGKFHHSPTSDSKKGAAEVDDNVSLATLLVNQYLDITGDYGGLALLRLYQVYRAMVRAKIACLDSHEQRWQQFTSYRDLALRLMGRSHPAIILMYGLSASGKSTVAATLAQQIDAIHIRSDRERKRLFGDNPHNQAGDLNNGLYSADITARTYQHLLELSRSISNAGFAVIVDATFLNASQRAPFQQLAQSLGISFSIIQLAAPIRVLQQRLEWRSADPQNISDATQDVLQHQQQVAQPPGSQENPVVVDTTRAIDYHQLAQAVLQQAAEEKL